MGELLTRWLLWAAAVAINGHGGCYWHDGCYGWWLHWPTVVMATVVALGTVVATGGKQGVFKPGAQLQGKPPTVLICRPHPPPWCGQR